VKAIEFTFNCFSRLAGFARAGEFPEVKQFCLHLPGGHKFGSQSFQVMVQREAAPQRAVNKEEISARFGR
jgi:hypothetical protein